MRTIDRVALAQACEQGYMVKEHDTPFWISETWVEICIEQGRPMCYVGPVKDAYTVILDTQTVYEYMRQEGRKGIAVPSLTPTEKQHFAVRRIAARYGNTRSIWGNSYTALYGVDHKYAEIVARMLLAVWDEAQTFAFASTLWEVEVAS